MNNIYAPSYFFKAIKISYSLLRPDRGENFVNPKQKMVLEFFRQNVANV